MKTQCFFVAPQTLVVSATNYFGPGSAANAVVATEGLVGGVIPAGCTVRNLYVNYGAGGPGAGTSVTATVRKRTAGAWGATSVAATIADTSVQANSGANSATFAAGDLIAIETTISGSPTSRVCSMCIEIESDVATQMIFFGCFAIGTSTATRYVRPFATDIAAPVTTENQTTIVAPCAGTVSKFYVEVTAAPGAGITRTLTFRTNETTDTSLVATVAGASDVAGNDTSNSVALSEGDLFTVKSTVSATAANANLMFGLVFVPTTAGEHFHGYNAAGTTSATRFTPVAGFVGDNGTETNRQCVISGATTWKKLRASLTNAPGGAATWTMTSRVGAAAGNQTTGAIADPNTTGSDGSNSDTLSAGNLIDFSTVPASTPAASRVRMSAVFFTAPSSGNLLLRMLGEGLFVGSNH